MGCGCSSGVKKITNIGRTQVVVSMRDLRDLMGRMDCDTPGRFERCGKYAVYEREDWSALLAGLKEDPENSLMSAMRGGGDCDEGCEEACEDHDGCDAAGGERGDCVWVCNDEEVILEL